MEKTNITVDVDELYKSTYKKIANWHNDNPTKEALEQLSMEIIDNIVTTIAKGFDSSAKVKLKEN